MPVPRVQQSIKNCHGAANENIYMHLPFRTFPKKIRAFLRDIGTTCATSVKERCVTGAAPCSRVYFLDTLPTHVLPLSAGWFAFSKVGGVHDNAAWRGGDENMFIVRGRPSFMSASCGTKKRIGRAVT